MTGSTTSRRTLVRSAAWTAPAIAVVATAPPASATSGGTLEVSLGSTSVRLHDYAEVQFSGFTVRANGRSIDPGKLAVVVSFAPTSPSTAHYVWCPFSFTSGWSFPYTPYVPAADTVPVVFTGKVLDGQTVQLTSPGFLIWTRDLWQNQPGSFVFTVTAPGFSATTLSLLVPSH